MGSKSPSIPSFSMQHDSEIETNKKACNGTSYSVDANLVDIDTGMDDSLTSVSSVVDTQILTARDHGIGIDGTISQTL